VDNHLVDWLSAEAPDRQVYEQPPLALALCQVRFTTRFGFSDAGVAPFQAEIEDRYPNPESKQVATLQIIGPSGSVGLPSPPQSTQWQFMDETGDWTVTLTNEFVTLETRSYAHFDDFLARLRWVLQALTKTVRPGLARRIGLRYINEIKAADSDWLRVVRREILGPLAIPAFQASCDQAIQSLSLRTGDALITFNHGAFPTGSTVVPKPGASAGQEPFYLLDIDMYQEFNPPKALKMDPSLICRHVEGFHDTVSKLFRWSTTAEYRASLGVRDNVR
jgi:uncharacterized protein (TIGR04255 family)